MNTVTILFPGDMGGNVAAALAGSGIRVTSFLEGRSDETKRMARQAGVVEVHSMAEAAAVSDLIISLVPPGAVRHVAAEYIAAAAGMKKPARFVDMNAKSTAAAVELAGMFAAAGIPFTNACIIGRASHVREEGVIYSSGQPSPELERTVGRTIRTVYLGGMVSAATAFKMCFAGFSKTITAAIFEVATAANRFGVTDRLFEQITEKMPGIVSDVGRLIGNYPRHLDRRRQEMEELAQTLASASLPHYIASAAAETMAGIERRKNFDAFKGGPDAGFMELMKSLRV